MSHWFLISTDYSFCKTHKSPFGFNSAAPCNFPTLFQKMVKMWRQGFLTKVRKPPGFERHLKKVFLPQSCSHLACPLLNYKCIYSTVKRISIAGLPAAGCAAVHCGRRGRGSTVGQGLRFVPLFLWRRKRLLALRRQMGCFDQTLSVRFDMQMNAGRKWNTIMKALCLCWKKKKDSWYWAAFGRSLK